MANPPLFLDSKRRELQPGFFARESDPPLPEDVAWRAANRTTVEAAKAKKDQKKAKKERAKLQRGRCRQGLEECNDDEEEEEEEDPNIPWGMLALEDDQANVGHVNLTPIL